MNWEIMRQFTAFHSSVMRMLAQFPSIKQAENPQIQALMTPHQVSRQSGHDCVEHVERSFIPAFIGNFMEHFASHNHITRYQWERSPANPRRYPASRLYPDHVRSALSRSQGSFWVIASMHAGLVTACGLRYLISGGAG